MFKTQKLRNKEGHTKYNGSKALSEYGRDYLKDCIMEFKNETPEHKQFFKSKLSKKVIEFLCVASNVSLVGSFILIILNL